MLCTISLSLAAQHVQRQSLSLRMTAAAHCVVRAKRWPRDEWERKERRDYSSVIFPSECVCVRVCALSPNPVAIILSLSPVSCLHERREGETEADLVT